MLEAAQAAAMDLETVEWAPAQTRATESFDGLDLRVAWSGDEKALAHRLKLAAAATHFRLQGVTAADLVGGRAGEPLYRCRFVYYGPRKGPERRATLALLDAIDRLVGWYVVERLMSVDGRPSYPPIALKGGAQ